MYLKKNLETLFWWHQNLWLSGFFFCFLFPFIIFSIVFIFFSSEIFPVWVRSWHVSFQSSLKSLYGILRVVSSDLLDSFLLFTISNRYYYFDSRPKCIVVHILKLVNFPSYFTSLCLYCIFWFSICVFLVIVCMNI